MTRNLLISWVALRLVLATSQARARAKAMVVESALISLQLVEK